MRLEVLDMALTKIKLGKLISMSEDKNTDGKYGINKVKGISIQKRFIETKADMDGVSLKPYLLVKPEDFAYVTVTSRNGEKITLAHNTTDETYIVSSSYVVFRVIRKDILLPEYLFMYFNRSEFDRYSRFNSWGSARETFSWEEMCDIDFELPSIEIQRKYVEIYKGMVDNQAAYETGLEDLKLVCDAYIEDLRRKYPCEKIGNYIELKREKNANGKITDVYGVSNTLQFITASSTVDRSNLFGYKIVEFEDMAYVPTTHMKIWAAAISDKLNPFVVSPIYEVFRVINKNQLSPQYLFMWLCRSETIRYAYFNSWGSARENFVFEDLCSISVPISNIEIQQDIVNIYKVYNQRKQINEQLKQQIKTICPVLIKGAVEEAKRS